MEKYTVVVYRLHDEDTPFVAHVEAKNFGSALDKGVKEALRCDKRDDKDFDKDEHSYSPLVVFEGHIQPVGYGFQHT